jgi:hypothetical protein
LKPKSVRENRDATDGKAIRVVFKSRILNLVLQLAEKVVVRGAKVRHRGPPAHKLPARLADLLDELYGDYTTTVGSFREVFDQLEKFMEPKGECKLASAGGTFASKGTAHQLTALPQLQAAKFGAKQIARGRVSRSLIDSTHRLVSSSNTSLVWIV